ncbi:hypothetical protein SLU01_14300 [Sporosarcina luteola]|uniref:Uncharacterized protein n=1 Tax=Sporosarcina luteola TaxID=582850 RepID=A0A511Z6Q3_9BACL|nr:hypothetical protein SLU01_14300 [Sporosarcina luteola]
MAISKQAKAHLIVRFFVGKWLSGDKSVVSGDNTLLSGDKAALSGDNYVLSGDKADPSGDSPTI